MKKQGKLIRMLVTRELKMCKRPSEVVANTSLTLAPIGVSPMAENLKI
jgi:hypothetical protein